MTAEELSSLWLPIPDSSRLYVEAGLEWLQAHTRLDIDLKNLETIKTLPSSAQLFLVKFCEICSRDAGISSESVGPLSQSFTSDSTAKQTYALGRQLLSAYLKPNVEFIPCQRRWR